jgi:hypothetical protein
MLAEARHLLSLGCLAGSDCTAAGAVAGGGVDGGGAIARAGGGGVTVESIGAGGI